MRHFFFLQLAFLNTFKKKLRALLAIGGIALTSATMVILFGVQMGLEQLVNQEVARADARDVVTVNQRNAQQVKLNTSQLSRIQSLSGVSEVGVSVGLLGSAVYHGIDFNVPLYGVSREYLGMSATKKIAGTVEGQPDGEKIVVSTKVLRVFGLEEGAAIGRTIQLSASIPKDYASKQMEAVKPTKPKNYTIAGVIDRGENPVILMPIEQLRMSGLDSVAQLKIRVTIPEKVIVVREAIEQMGLQTTSVLDTIDQINKLFSVIRDILLVFAFVIFVITVSGTFTIITLTLMEETQQIGFLRIMGLRRGDVRLLFTVQSIILTVFGAIVGVVIGVIGGFMLNGLAQATAQSKALADDVTIFVVPLLPVVIILAVSVLIGWLVGIIPAKRAAFGNPLEELHS